MAKSDLHGFATAHSCEELKSCTVIKFRFSKKATKFETISHVICRLLSKCQIKWEIVSNFLSFSEYPNLNREKRGTQLINAPTYDVNSDVLKNFRFMLYKKNYDGKKSCN